jgi:hypothetical protein
MRIDGWIRNQIGETQFDFFRKNKSGCLFAAIAAKNPSRYGWSQKIISLKAEVIDASIEQAHNNKTTMLSLVFPTVNSTGDLLRLIEVLCSTRRIMLEQNVEFDVSRCLSFRANIEELSSWITGFGPFKFLPTTRQSPYTEIALRVKPRPLFPWVMKESPPGVIHLADLDMLGMADAMFRSVWRATIERTTRLLGHKADLRSAAKTTFAIPTELLSNIYSSSVIGERYSTQLTGSNVLPLA